MLFQSENELSILFKIVFTPIFGKNLTLKEIKTFNYFLEYFKNSGILYFYNTPFNLN